ncbi:MAG: helix-turn-helix domain-containing protein [Drouetiella hepatica Uher 2000/2452]|jgi:transcriptional regulator with XRE-family HTH domain|uniref:Helix-turn-helix domain-containing protein n=1 Tax=Drouetiella hepatica Uher 2000/2452 TaxID=904376 RepID=A0A951QFP5_9CYAN|nr:helix-turn-helix domain-containing protein [Drouetiella hepatica Uher 2000/2452]
MDSETRERLIKVVKLARGSMSQRQFAKLLGVSSTAVQLWEKGETMPDTKNLAQIATRAGYTIEGLVEYLTGHKMPEFEEGEVDKILRQVQLMPLQQVAVIGQAIAERFVSELGDASPDFSHAKR